MVTRIALATLIVIASSTTSVLAQDEAPDTLDAPSAVETPEPTSDPAGNAPSTTEPGTDVPTEGAPAEEASDGASGGDTKREGESTSEGESKSAPESESVDEAATPWGGVASFAVAYATGLVTMGVMHGLTIAGAALSVANLVLGAAASPILGPVGNVLSAVSIVACCFLPAGQGALINLVGDTVTGSDPSLAYLWTILASYVSCYAFGCVGALTYGAIIFAVIGASIAALFTGQAIPGQENMTYLFAGASVGIFGLVAVVQPLVPATVYAMTRDTGAAVDDEYVDTDDGTYVERARRAPSRPEVAFTSSAPRPSMAY